MDIVGRTGRIGHRGVATSLFDPSHDEGIASVLTRTLLETKQEIPEFLQMYIPQSGACNDLRFETESDYDAEEAQQVAQVGEVAAVGSAWGQGQAEEKPAASEGWGSNGWGQPDNGNAAVSDGWGSASPAVGAAW